MNIAGIRTKPFRRIFFTNENRIMALLRFAETPEELIKANVMNLTEGDFVIAVNKDKKFEDVGKGVHLTLIEIKGKTAFLNIDETETEVKWLLRHQYLDYVGLGCEFINATDATRKQLRQLVASSDHQR